MFSLQFFVNFFLNRCDDGRVGFPLPFLWDKQVGIGDESIHQKIDFREQFCIIDTDSEAALVIHACPALLCLAFGIDAPHHRVSALPTLYMITQESDGFAVFDELISLTGCLGGNCLFEDFLIDDGVILLASDVSGVIYDSLPYPTHRFSPCKAPSSG